MADIHCFEEILTNVLSHLHPDSHSSVALVSKRFYSLVTTPHAWRMAFFRYFPGHTSLKTKSGKGATDFWKDAESSDVIRSETRYFARLTPLASWRSEFLFRTRLIRNLVRGKPGTRPGNIGTSARSNQSNKKSNAVLTFNSKLPWLVTSIHAVFSNGKKPPRAIQGASDVGAATVGDPTSGKIEKWGLEDAFTFLQLEEVMPHVVPYGLGDGPAAAPNVIEVSHQYGMLAGEGYPGGRAYFRGMGEMRGRYLGADSGVVDTYPEIPKIPELSEAISSVWLAKTNAVPSVSQSMIGMMTGSTLGVVTAYSVGWDPSGPRHSNGQMTARWVLSPGVPIISLKIDDQYTIRRKSSSRVWAVALNALGEVFYLTEVPKTVLDGCKGEDVMKNAWFAGRTAYWHLVEETRRMARVDEWDKNALRGAYSPRSPSHAMNLSKEQMAAEAREIEKFMLYRPSHFNKACQGWDMRRCLEVDFASDDGKGAGERVFVIDCGLAENVPANIQRYSRSIYHDQSQTPKPTIAPIPSTTAPSLFGSGENLTVPNLMSPESQSPRSPPPTPLNAEAVGVSPMHDWTSQKLSLRPHASAIITTSALDCSAHAVQTLSEDQLHIGAEATNGTSTTTQQAEIPGRRARLLAIGTKGGNVLVWNAREPDSATSLQPVRVIHTESPSISSLALNGLYLVHGGSDGLVQAWDPLASHDEPLRTINGRSNGRVPRHMTTMNPALHIEDYTAAGAIFLDTDPTVLRGIVSFGAFMRYWSYSSHSHPTGRKRRARHSDIHGRIASRRLGGTSARYIAAEEAELRRENEQRAREQTRLRNRFGVGALGDLTEEEALHYARMVSEETFTQDENRRASASDSAADASVDTASSFSVSTQDTITPEPSVADPATPTVEESEYEKQIQQAIRLSLMEGVNEPEQSPQGNSSGDFDFAIKFKPRGNKKGKPSGSGSGSGSPNAHYTTVNGVSAGSSSKPLTTEDEDLALALSLSMQDQQTLSVSPGSDDHMQFPPLDTGSGTGKGKGVQRW